MSQNKDDNFLDEEEDSLTEEEELLMVEQTSKQLGGFDVRNGDAAIKFLADGRWSVLTANHPPAASSYGAFLANVLPCILMDGEIMSRAIKLYIETMTDEERELFIGFLTDEENKH